jgi:hypothetical protein
MGVPYNGSNMAQHPQYITVRNSRGREMLDCLGAELQRMPAVSKGNSRPLVMQVGYLCAQKITMWLRIDVQLQIIWELLSLMVSHVAVHQWNWLM